MSKPTNLTDAEYKARLDSLVGNPTEPVQSTPTLEAIKQYRAQQAAREDKAFVSDRELGTFSGQSLQMLASVLESGSRTIGDTLAIPFTASAASALAPTTDQDRIDYKTVNDYLKSGKDMENAPQEILDAENRLNQPRAVKATSQNRSETITAREAFEQSEAYQSTANSIDEFFNISDIVNPLDRQTLSGDLEETYNKGMPQVKEGIEKIFRGDENRSFLEGLGDVVEGVGDVISGSASLVGGGASDLASNPAATASYIAGIVPDLVVAAKSSLGLALTSAGYGLDTYNKGIQDFTKREGKLPTQEEQAQILAASATGAAADLIADKALVGKIPKGKGPVGVAAGVAGGTAKEAGTEGYQSLVEENLSKLDYDIKGSKIFESATIGGGIGGTISGAKETAGVLGSLKDKAATSYTESKELNQQEKASVSDYVETGNVDTLKDVGVETAIDSIVKRSKQDITPEEKDKNLQTAKSIRSEVLAEYLEINNKPEKDRTKEDNKKAKEILNQLYVIKNTIGGLESSTVSEAKTEGDDKAQRVFRSFKAKPDSITEQQATELIEGENSLTKLQKDQLTNHVEYTKATKSADEVGNDIMYGNLGTGAKQKFIGIQNYRDSITAALDSGNFQLAAKLGSQLKSFTDRHRQKAIDVAKAQDAYNNDTNPQDIKYVKDTYGLDIGKGSEKLVETIANEAQLLTKATQLTGKLYNSYVNDSGSKTNSDTDTTTEVKTEAPKQAPEKISPETQQSTPVKEEKPVEDVTEPTTDTQPESVEDTQAKTEPTKPKVIKEDQAKVSDRDLLQKRIQDMNEAGIPINRNTMETESYKKALSGEGDLSKVAIKNLNNSLDRAQASYNSKQSPNTIKEVPNKSDGSYSLQDSILSKEDPNAKNIKLENKVKKSFKSSGTKSALQSEPDMVSRMDSDYDMLKKYKPIEEITEEVSEGINIFTRFDRAFKDKFDKEVFEAINPKYKYRNYINYLLDDQGKLDPNVVSALAVSAFNWLANNGRGTLVNDKKNINGIYGRSSQAYVSPEMLDLLWDKGVIRSEVIDSLGSDALKALGLKLDPTKAEINDMSKLKQSLGTYALGTIKSMGLLEQNTVNQSDLTNALPTKRERLDSASKYNQKGKVAFIRAKAIGDNITDVKLSNGNQLLVDSTLLYPDLTKDFFDVDRAKQFPTEKAIPVADKMKNTNQDVPKKALDILNNHSKRNHETKANVSKVFSFLSETARRTISGYTWNVDKDIQINKRKGVISKNDALDREIDNHFEFQKILKTKGMKAFKLAHTMLKNMRVDQKGAINLLNSKIHRHLYSMDTWGVELDLNNSDHVSMLLMAIADSLGISTDKKTVSDATQDLFDKLNTPVYQNAVAAINQILKGTELTDKQTNAVEKAITEAVEAGGEKVFSLDGLVALTEYANAKSSGEDKVYTTLMREVDGVTNGVAFGTIQYAGASSWSDMVERMQRVGVFTDGETTSYGEYAKRGELDSYQDIALEWGKQFNLMFEAANKNKRKQYTALSNLIGDIVVEDKDGNVSVTSEGRNLTKPALMTTIYDAGEKAIAARLGTAVLEKIYDDLEKIALKNDVKELKAYIRNLNTAIGSQIINPNKVKFGSDAMELVLTTAQRDRVISVVAETSGVALNRAIGIKFKDFKNNSSLVRETFDAINVFAQQEYKRLVDEIIKERKLFGSWEDGISALTVKEMKSIEQELKKALPIIMSPMSTSINDGVMLGKYEQTKQESNNFLTDVKFKTDVGGGKTIKSKGVTPELADIGKAPSPIATQMLDAVTMIQTLADNRVMNIFDAIGGSITAIGKNTNSINKQFYDVNANYSILAQSQKALNRVREYIGSQESSEHGNGFIADSKIFEDDLHRAVLRTNRIKSQLLNKTTYITQYNLENHGYNIRQEDIDTANEELSKEYYDTMKGVFGSDSVKGMAPIVKKENDAVQDVVKVADNAPKDTQETNKEYTDEELFDGTFYSSQDDIDTSLPFDKHENVNNATTLEKFDMLDNVGNVIENKEHRAYLRDFVSNTVNKVIRPFNLHLTEQQGGDTRGMTNGTDMYIVNAITGTMPVISGMVGQGIKMSAQEVYAHELSHNITSHSLDSNPRMRDKVRKAWLTAKTYLDPEDLMNVDARKLSSDSAEYQLELEEAKARYEYIFTPNITQTVEDINPITGEKVITKKSNHLHEFLAFGTTNENFMNALRDKVKRPPIKGESIVQTLLNVLDYLLNFVQGKINGTYGLSADKEIQKLAEQLANLDNRKSSLIKSSVTKAEKLVSPVVNKTIDTIKAGAVKLGNSPILTTNRFKVVQAAGTLLDVIGRDNQEYVVDNALKVRDRIIKGKQGMIASLVSEARQRTDKTGVFHDLQQAKNKLVDISRKQIQDAVTKVTGEQYTTELSSFDKGAITDVLIRSDIASIDDAIGTEELMGLIKNPEKVEAMIDTYESKLNSFGSSSNFYINQARNLGYFMATGNSLYESGVIMNAKNISKLFFTDKVVPAYASRAEESIDVLASLYSLYYMDKNKKSRVAEIAKNESKEDALNNAITYTIGQHKRLKKDAQENTFKGSEELMIKGFTPDIINEQTALRIGTKDQEKEFNRQGYVLVDKPLPKDKADPFKAKTYMYVSRDAGHVEYMAGIMSLDSKKARGTSVADMRLSAGEDNVGSKVKQDNKAITNAKRKAFLRTFKPISRDTPSYVTNVMSPIANLDGTVKGWRYLASNNTKDTHLERVNDFDRVLGYMAASTKSKYESKRMNVKLIQALKEQFDTDFKDSPNSYLEISPNSGDPYLKEIWNMIPYESRIAARNSFGSDSIMVRNDILDLVFGYRKRSIQDPFVADRETLGVATGVFVDVMNRLFRGKAGTRLRKTERVLQEFIGWAKDIIVIRTGLVTLGNILSNITLLGVMGVPLKSIVADTQLAYKEAYKYQKMSQDLLKLQSDLEVKKLNQTQRASIEGKIAGLENDMSNSPVANMIESGVLQGIVEDIDTEMDDFSYRGRLEKRASKYTKFIPSAIKTSVEYATIGRDTKAYQLLRSAVQLSDFSSRYVLHKHLTSRKNNPMSNVEAIREVMDIFLNYDIPTNRNLQYGNDIGVLMFSKYLIRIQKIIFKMFKENPARSVSMLVLQNWLGDWSDISDSTLLAGTSPLTRVNNPLSLWDVFGQILTVNMASKAL